MSSIETTQLKKEDSNLTKIWRELAKEDWYKKKFNESEPLQNLLDFISDPLRIYIVATINGKIAGRAFGYILVHPNGNKTLYVDEVDTIKQFRLQGVATKLMKDMFHIAKQNQAVEVWLDTEVGNIAANATYKKLKPSEVEKAINYVYEVNNA